MFPKWVSDYLENNSKEVEIKTSQTFSDILALMPDFSRHFLSIEDFIDCQKIEDTSPLAVQKMANGKFAPMVLYVNIIEQLHHYFEYQIKEIACSIELSFEKNYFYVSNTLFRVMIEVACYYTYFFDKSEFHFQNSMTHFENARRTKSPEERNNQVLLAIKSLIACCNYLADCINSTSGVVKSNAPADRTENDEAIKKTHIHDCIRHVTKKSKLDVWRSYEIFSEFCHPNMGSRTLVVSSINEDKGGFISLRIGQTRSQETLEWFFKNNGEGVYQCMTLSLSLNHRLAARRNSILNSLDASAYI